MSIEGAAISSAADDFLIQRINPFVRGSCTTIDYPITRVFGLVLNQLQSARIGRSTIGFADSWLQLVPSLCSHHKDESNGRYLDNIIICADDSSNGHSNDRRPQMTNCPSR
ncbi:hypothetical protein L596_008092 [Steinernema carpocapsae]|uniref:Uncharacterized protein n=1 Tax=Steinernema carpocapsae TaxID=34508 RepID=A0A4U5PBP2_STECR|nr:hypothetical protein L596_008092 [Steinernema carpocapsae]